MSFDVSSLADSGSDWLGKANELLSQGARAYQTVTGVTKSPQTAAEVAAGKPAKPESSMTPILIGVGVVVVGVLIWLGLRKP